MEIWFLFNGKKAFLYQYFNFFYDLIQIEFFVCIQRYYLTANSCIHEGYAEYNWPEGWREDSMSASMCGEVSPDGEGAPEQFW